MKRIIKNSFSILLLSMLFSCAHETIVPVIADFSIKVIDDDYTVPVKVEVTNNTEGADTYEWYFQGATVERSNRRVPKRVIYTRAGNYTITLKASNKDGSQSKKSIKIKIDPAMKASFSWEREGSAISPVKIQMVNESLGATEYYWEFENGIPASSTLKAPEVTFTEPGDHLIKLRISNGKETYHTEKSITVEPAMTIDFDWSVDFIDQDYQAPVTLYLKNKSTNADSYLWEVEGAETFDTALENPEVTFNTPGEYSIQLNAINDKETKKLIKKVRILPNNNLLSFKDIKLGINTAKNTLGCFFSSKLGKVLTQNEVSKENGSVIDFAYFGLNSNFTYNQVVSPDEVQNTAFLTIPSAKHSKVINSQEVVGVQLTSHQFDLIDNGNDLSSVNIEETNKGKTPFDQQNIPRIVLFETSDGRKGAIKIKSYISQGKDSYILTDIKVQKKP